jgi:hypothetical protein
MDFLDTLTARNAEFAVHGMMSRNGMIEVVVPQAAAGSIICLGRNPGRSCG